MKKTGNEGISSFQKYLTLWVLACMIAGVIIGHFMPLLPAALGKMEVAGISIPMGSLILLIGLYMFWLAF